MKIRNTTLINAKLIDGYDDVNIYECNLFDLIFTAVTYADNDLVVHVLFNETDEFNADEEATRIKFKEILQQENIKYSEKPFGAYGFGYDIEINKVYFNLS